MSRGGGRNQPRNQLRQGNRQLREEQPPRRIRYVEKIEKVEPVVQPKINPKNKYRERRPSDSPPKEEQQKAVQAEQSTRTPPIKKNSDLETAASSSKNLDEVEPTLSEICVQMFGSPVPLVKRPSLIVVEDRDEQVGPQWELISMKEDTRIAHDLLRNHPLQRKRNAKPRKYVMVSERAVES